MVECSFTFLKASNASDDSARVTIGLCYCRRVILNQINHLSEPNSPIHSTIWRVQLSEFIEKSSLSNK
jgi:hypothetical protein